MSDVIASTYTCPRCGMTSSNPHDAREGYCGNCHAWTVERDSVALWVIRYGVTGYDLYDSEDEAAGMACALVDNGDAAILGVQFADGRAVKSEEWVTYQAERARRCAEPPPDYSPRPSRKALDPFGFGREVDIYEGDPEWLGRPPFPGG